MPITSPRRPEDGDGARLAMVNALRDAALNPTDVQYINAHATSTPLGDKAETIAMKRAFGDARQQARRQLHQVDDRPSARAPPAWSRRSSRCSPSATASPRRPSTTARPDPECDLDYVPNTARRMPIDVSLSNSFGFGGTNGSLIFRRFSA